MVEVEPFDDIEDGDCRWTIKGWGVVFGKDLEEELKKRCRAMKEEAEEAFEEE